MLNDIYLMLDEKRHHALVKPGFAKDLTTRIYAYTTHNPEVRCISHIRTMKKSGRKVEAMFHAELTKRGYETITANIDGKKTEWIKIPYDDPFYSAICEQGQCAFTCGKRRKNYGELKIGA